MINPALRPFSLVLVCALVASAAGAQSAHIVISPQTPAPGAVVRLTLDASADAGARVMAVRGEMGGEPLHFRETSVGIWRAIAGVPVDAADSVVARAILARSSGFADTVHAWLTLPPRPPARPPQRLAVDARFTQPLDAATQARIARENERAREVGRQAHMTPPLWSEPFLQPREARITSGFGSGRTFNGRTTSRHLGVDFAGGIGTPVRAANRGVVALADTFFLGGRVVYLDHGAGVVTGYLHLSEIVVAAGDTVGRGQRIGSVGATGRVTGPHLHWNARYGALTVNPLDLVELGTWYGADTPGTPTPGWRE